VSASVASPLRAFATFKDCDACPEMVEVPPGEFLMGSPDSEVGHTSVEGPQRRVRIPHWFALGRTEVTVEQFSAFITQTVIEVSSSCQVGVQLNGGDVVWGEAKASFREPGFEITGSHPATCINWHDAEAYAAWLSRRTGKAYRLPTEAEWEYAARAGSST